MQLETADYFVQVLLRRDFNQTTFSRRPTGAATWRTGRNIRIVFFIRPISSIVWKPDVVHKMKVHNASYYEPMTDCINISRRSQHSQECKDPRQQCFCVV